jgi:hypothetical protein
MITISLNDFLSKIGDKKKEVKFTTYTDPKLKKTGNPYNGVKKIQTATVEVNFNYQSTVNKQRMAEGKELDFTPKSRVWGTRIDDSCIIEHNGEMYIESRLIKKDAAYYIDENRKMLSKDEIAPFMPAVSKSKNQDLDTEVIINTFKVSNIKEVEIDGVTYLLR